VFSLPGNEWASAIAMGVVGAIVSLISQVLVLITGFLLALLRPHDEITVTWRGVHIVPIPREPESVELHSRSSDP
jgi:hypothetical protein